MFSGKTWKQARLWGQRQGEVQPLGARARGCVPGHPDEEGGELGQGLERGKNEKRKIGRNHLLGIRKCSFQRNGIGTPLVAQWLRLPDPSAGGWGLIPGQGTRCHKPQLRVCTPQLKTLCATRKIEDLEY